VRLTFCAEPAARVAEGARRLGEAVAALLSQRPARVEQEQTAALGVV
jgi:hypothetical protein